MQHFDHGPHPLLIFMRRGKAARVSQSAEDGLQRVPGINKVTRMKNRAWEACDSVDPLKNAIYSIP